MSSSAANALLLDASLRWRDRPASADIRHLPKVNVPVLRAVRKALPVQGAHRTLAAAYATALRLSQLARLLRQAKAESLEQLRARPLEEADALAQKIAKQSGWLAASSGAALGVAGLAGWVADVPALLLLALRTLVRIGYCYGEPPSAALVAALFALASADTEDEKRLAWNAALSTPVADAEIATSIRDAALRDGLERAVEREFAKQALNSSLQKLLTTLVQRLGLKKAAGALPVLGAVVGGVVNLRFVHQLGEAARMVFVARRLLAEGMPSEALLFKAPTAVSASPPKTTRRRRPAPVPAP